MPGWDLYEDDGAFGSNGAFQGDTNPIASAIAGPYLLLAGAHFIGLFFRENEAALEEVYLYS